MADLRIRWSALEAEKPYASPFGVTFVADGGEASGAVAVSGPDLVYYENFQQAVLDLAGELFSHRDVERSQDPQRAWLDYLSARMQPLVPRGIQPQTVYDERVGDRRFRFTIRHDDGACVLDAQTISDYQQFQAVGAHHTGRLYRNGDIEAIDDPLRRRIAWNAVLHELMARPGADDAMTAVWPWR